MAVTAWRVVVRGMVVLLSWQAPGALWKPLGAGARPGHPILWRRGHIWLPEGLWRRSVLGDVRWRQMHR